MQQQKRRPHTTYTAEEKNFLFYHEKYYDFDYNRLAAAFNTRFKDRNRSGESVSQSLNRRKRPAEEGANRSTYGLEAIYAARRLYVAAKNPPPGSSPKF